MDVGSRIRAAREALPDYTQRDLEAATGISQSTLARLENGRAPKMNELISIAWALGVPLTELTGESPVAGRLVCAARTTNSDSAATSMDAMRAALTHFFELDAYLDTQGISASA